MSSPKADPFAAWDIKFRIVYGIDPGSSSGAIVRYHTHETHDPKIECLNIPDTEFGLWATINDRLNLDRVFCEGQRALFVVEKVGGSMPGNSSRSSRTFAEHMGALRMALIAAGATSTWFVIPRRWMGDLYADTLPSGMENKSLRKTAIYDDMVKRYPNLKFTKRQADALGITTWAVEKLRAQGALQHG